MKYKFLVLKFILLTILPISLFAQAVKNTKPSANASETTRGKVTDIYGTPLPGVSVTAKQTNVTTRSDSTGAYSIKANPGQVLVFALNGYAPQEAVITNRETTIVMKEGFTAYDVNRLYDVKKKSLSVESSSSVHTADLITSPTADFSAALAGRLAGLSTTQSSGAPGSDGASLSLRGQTPLVLINGIPRNYTSIDPEEIESVTVLKDALSAAMLGLRSSNGVLLIKTKSGEVGKQKISITAQSGIQSPLKLPQPLNAFDYATLYNEALGNDGKPLVYTPADLMAYKNGTDPIGHPNVNWYNTLLKPNSRFSRYNFTASGGSSSARYFVGVDYLDQQGLYNEDPINTYSTNTDFKRYLIRSNVDLDLTKNLLLNINLFGRIENGNFPGNYVNLFSSIANTPNNAYPVFNSDGSLGGNASFQNNLWGQSTRSGYSLNYSRDVSADVSLKRLLDDVTKGLWVKALVSFNTSLYDETYRTKSFAVYQQNTDPTTGLVSYTPFGVNGVQSNTGAQAYPSSNLYSEFSTGYHRSFGNNNFQVLLMENNQSITPANINLPVNYTTGSGSIDYNYKEKYLFEATASYSGLNRYPVGKRAGLFPAVGLGWNIAQEDFLKGDVKWLNALKLRTSYGRTGNTEQMLAQAPASSLYFGYNQYYNANTSTYYFGNSATSATGYAEGVLANPNLTWEKANKFNIGIDAGFFNNKLTASLDYYNNRYYDLLQIRGSNTTIIGNSYPLENIGVTRYTGFEFESSYHNHVGNLNYFASINITSSRNRILYQDEPYRKYDWMKSTGLANNQVFGYIAEGFYQNQADINSSAKPTGYNPKPGDIKFKDINGDGVIDVYDVTSLRPDKPQIFYGLNCGFSYKGLDANILLQGATNRTEYLSNPSTEFEFQNNGLGQAYQQHLGRWTPATASTATYPRLTVGANVNNQATSSFWMHNGNYLRLKNAEVGYTLPKSVTNKLSIASLRLFVNGYNLLTEAAYSRVDPESNGTNYPALRTINAGINIKL